MTGFAKEHKVDLRKDPMALQRLKDAAEKAKCELSSVRETEINLPFIISTGPNEALHLQRVLTRTKLEELTLDLVERTLDICRMTLEDAELKPEDIKEVVLVGGMTRMPKVQERVASFFGREPSKGVHPDEVVALGAAIQAAALVEKSDRRPAARRHAALAGHHGGRRLLPRADRAQHHGAHLQGPRVHHHPRRPDVA